ncbi:MAG TPA: TIGR03435 family protein, partial [Bryobacteraceae bacterium]
SLSSLLRLTLVAVGVTSSLGAQPPGVFDAASIRINRSGERGFRTGGLKGGLYQAMNIPTRILVAQAFGVRESQIANAPGWTENERYDITAKANPNSGGGEQLKPLLQSMLTERFQLRFHRETRDIPGYALVVAKGGLTIRQNHGTDTPDLRTC